MPKRSQRSAIPPGLVIEGGLLAELIAAAPISIAPGLPVVTAGTVRLGTSVAELAVFAGAASGAALARDGAT